MKTLKIYCIGSLFIALSSCGSNSETLDIALTNPKTLVDVATIGNEVIQNKLRLLGKTIYQKRNLLTAPIPAFIKQVNVKLGDRVVKGDLLYILQSKESKALGNHIRLIDSTISNFGIIYINAATNGVISTLDKQQAGDYVLEGTLLCTIAESSDLTIQVNVPYEYTQYTKEGDLCELILPDKSKYKASFIRSLSVMNVLSQTQIILAKSRKDLLLPENMIVQINVAYGRKNKMQTLPRSCVLSDEMRRSFWVMKMVNDSMALKIPVQIGNKNKTNIEILSPQFSLSDKIISVGNYGLSDSALVVQNEVL